MGDPIKDKFYYGAADYLRKKNPNISQEEVLVKVDEFRQNPEKYYADSYKELTGKTIDKKALEQASNYDGLTVDPNKLSPSEINFIDNDKSDILNDYNTVQKLSSEIELPLNATDEEISRYVDKTMSKRPVSDYKTEKELAINNFKKKRDKVLETQKSYYDKINSIELSPIGSEDFFADARKKTEKTGLIKAITDVGDYFSGNDAKEELTNANLKSQQYIKVLEDQTNLKLGKIKDPKEREIAIGILSNKKPELEEGFKPSPELESFVKTYDAWGEQYDINANQFGSVIDGKKKTYNQQLAENRQKKQEEVDKEQPLFSNNDIAKILTAPFVGATAALLPSDKSPSVASTWINNAIEGMLGGAIDLGDPFYSNKLEAQIKEAKKNGNQEEYLNLQKKLALNTFKDQNDKMQKTLQRSDYTGPIWESDSYDIDGFHIQVNSKGEFQRMVDVDGKTIHNLSVAQQKAVEKYQENPKAYKKNNPWFSRGWYKSLGNSVAQTTVEMVPMIAGGMATAPLRGMGMIGATASKVVPMTPMFMRSYHDHFTDRFERTGDWSNSSTYGILNASLEAIPEMMFGIEPKLLRSLTNRGLTAEVAQTAGKRAADIVANSNDLYKHSFMRVFKNELAKDVGTEMAEEFFTLYSQSAVKKIYGEEGAVSTNDIVTTLLVTPLATAPMSSITNISNYKKNTDFKTMILAAASDYDKTVELMTEAVHKNKVESAYVPGKVKNFINKIDENDVKKKLDLVKAVATRKDRLGERAAGMNLDFTEKENTILEDYMFEEAVGEINGKKVDYTKEVDAIIAQAAKRSKLAAAQEVNEEIIPVDEAEIVEAEKVLFRFTPLPKDYTFGEEPNERMQRPLRKVRPKMEPAPAKNKKGFRKINSMGPDGQYDTLYNTDTRNYIGQGEIALNFNISNDDSAVLAEEIQDIADKEGISVRMDIAKAGTNTDIPLLVSFENQEDAQRLHSLLQQSEYYNQMVPQKTDRVLGKTIDPKVQFGVRNIKDLRNAQDVVENSTRNENGTYTYNSNGMEETMSREEYSVFEDILLAADNMWNSPSISTTEPSIQVQGTPTPPIVSMPEPVQTEPQTRTIDERGFERLNVKSDVNLQDAFDYVDGDKKEIPVYRNGQKGILRVDEGGAMEFDNGKQIIELGNINDQRTTTLSELGLTPPEDFKVKNGNIVIDGEMYQNPYSSPDAAIIRDEDGNILSVELEKREVRGGYNGIQVNDIITPVTFTGQRAKDVATILMENELASNEKLREEFESFPAPDIQPSLVPNNVTVDQLGEILLDYFPDKPALAMETAKIYFAQAARMSSIFPQQYPTPASYIIEKINKDTVENVTDIERIKNMLNNIINTTDNQERIDFAQRSLDNLNRIQAIKVQTPQQLIDEINSKPLSHISLGEGVGMGQNEANGTYLSTETSGNRYEIIKTKGAKLFSAKVKIERPYDLDAEMDDITSMRNRNLPAAIKKYVSDNKLTGDLKKQIESVQSFDSEILESFPGFDQYVANEVTNELVSKGYDSIYSRQSETREGYLVVFNPDNVKLTEVKFKEKTVKKDGRGKSTFAKINNIIDEIGFTIDPIVHAIKAVTSGKISRDSYLQEVSPSTQQALDLILKKVLTISNDGVNISKAAENLPDQVDEMDVRNNIIDLLNNYNYTWMLTYVTGILESKNNDGKSPEELRFEEDPEFRQHILQMEMEAELEKELFGDIPEELYADIMDAEMINMSDEDIVLINAYMDQLGYGENLSEIVSNIPFDPEFEFISQQIENKIEDGKQEDVNQGEDGNIVAGAEGENQRQNIDDRQEDQGEAAVDNAPKVVNEIERVQKLEFATQELKKAKSKLSNLEGRVTEMRKNIGKRANQNLFSDQEMGINNQELGFDVNINDQSAVLAAREKEVSEQREVVKQLEKEIESLRDLKNQAELNFNQIVEPISELGNGSKVYYETPRYRVNDSMKGGVILNIQNQEGDMSIASINFDNAQDAVIIAEELNRVYPNGVPDALLIDQYIETLKNTLLNKEVQQAPTENPNQEFDKTEEINAIKEEIDNLRSKMKKGYYPEHGLDARRIGELRDQLKELEPSISDVKDEVSKKKEKIDKIVKEVKAKNKKEPISDLDKEINSAVKDLLNAFRNNKQGIIFDPEEEARRNQELLTMGLKVVDLYIKKGFRSFEEMVKDAALNIGEMTEDLIDAMKQAYAYAFLQRSNSRGLTTQLNDVADFRLDKLINKIEDEQRGTNANVGGSPKRTTRKVQPTNQGQLSFDIPEQQGGPMPNADQEVSGNVGDERIGSGGSSNSGNVGTNINNPTNPIDYFEISADTRPFNPSVRMSENIQAINLLSDLYEDRRPATREEKDILSKYVGFGGLKVILNDPNQTWTETDEKLRPLYNQLIQAVNRLEEQTGYSGLLDNMKTSTLNAHFTAIPIIQSVYTILDDMGFKGGVTLEPSAGTGNFIGAMPLTMRSKSKITSIEKEPITGMINRLIYPENTTIINGYEDSGIRNNSQDLVVSNIPFGDYKVYDKTLSTDQKRVAKNIHNYFFVKSINTAREGGIIAFITSTGVMDSPGNKDVREYIAKNTNFLGAFRLPNTTFQGNANTMVTTDIIFLQKNTTNPSSNYSFVENQLVTLPNGKTLSVNEYFAQNQDAIIGQLESSRGLYREDEMVVTAPKDMDVAQEMVQRAQEMFPKGIYQKGSPQKNETTIDDTVPSDTIYVKDGQVLFNNVLGVAKSLPKAISVKQAEDFIKLRNTLSELYFESLNNPNSERVNDLRKQLNTDYDVFVKQHGKLSTTKNMPLIRDDRRGIYMKTLEKDGKKADIFFKNTISSNEKPTIVNFNDALVYSLQEKGMVDIDFISDLLDRPINEIVSENYNTYIFDDGYGNIITREEYLSGNVKQKLKEAQKLAKTNPLFETNVSELEKVIPADINPLDIEVNIGARWVDTKYYVEFLNEILNNKQTNVIYARGTDEYAVDGPYTVESTTKYGTPYISAYKIFSKILEGRTPVITYKTADGKQIVDKEKTAVAVEKQALIKEAFDNWIWRDADRRETLSRIYNDTYNTTIKRKYDGSHLNLPGLEHFKLRPHQKDAIWMVMQNNGGIIDHIVGAGKTAIMISGAIELKRTGIAKKPVIIGLKSTIPHLVADAKRMYPMAKVLAPKSSDFEKSNRKSLIANIANNDYDIIIMSHEQFGKIPQNPNLLIEIMEEELGLIEKEIRGIDSSNQLGKRAENGLIKRKENIEAKIKELSDMSKDEDLLSFDKTGIDHLMVDESQQFKNLEYTTKVQGIAGLGDPTGSQRAFNLLTAIRQLQQNNGSDKGTTFLSGTPISNSMVEMYLLLKYLRPNKLKELGFDTFDAWAKQFARESSDLEFTVAGTISNKTRFREFINIPELSIMYNEIADVRNDNNLTLDKPNPIEELIVIRQSQEQKNYTSMLVDFANTGVAPEGLGLGPTTDNMKSGKMLIITTESAKSAIDMRLIFPDALDNPTGKLQIAADKITEIYQNTRQDKGTQLVFSDLGTPKTGNITQDLKDILQDVYKVGIDDLNAIFHKETEPEKLNSIQTVKKNLREVLEYDVLQIEDLITEARESSNIKFTIYEEIRKKLIENGVDSNEIAFIHDYKTDKSKLQLFEKVNAGDIRIVLGSTSKLGTGVNVQERIVAMHHIDVPWNPAYMEQRNGRGIRQGNFLAKEKYNNEVQIFKYGTEQTLDAYKYQLLDIKSNFITKIKDGSVNKRVEEEDDSNEGAKIIAALSGNPLIYEKAVLEKNIDKMVRSRKNHSIELSNAELGLSKNQSTIDESSRKLEEIRQDEIVIKNGYRTVGEEKLPTITIKGVELEKDEKGKYKDIGKAILSVRNPIFQKPVGYQEEIATINNLPLYAKLLRDNTDSFKVELFVKGKGIYPVSSSSDAGAQATAITRFLTNFTKEADNLKADVIRAKERVKSYSEFISEKGVWEGEQELMEARSKLYDIKEQLDSDKNKNKISEEVDKTISDSVNEMIMNGDVVVIDPTTGEPCS